MILKATQHNLDKLEELFHELEYAVRFEKGNFRSGACTLQDNKVVVVNKFATIDQKIAALAEILNQSEVDESLLSDKMKSFYHSLKQTKLSL